MGAGAALKTKLSECSQAYISAILDAYNAELPRKTKDGKYENFTYEDLKTTLKPIVLENAKNKISGNLGGVSIISIEKFLKDHNDWFLSSINIANKVYHKLDQVSIGKSLKAKIAASGDYLYYYRGDTRIFPLMRDIFASIKKSIKNNTGVEVPYQDVNKWNPADIYYASKNALEQLNEFKQSIPNKKTINFDLFNKLLFDLIDSGDLLPLSLKKSPNYDQTVVKTIRIVRRDVEKTLTGIGYKGYVFSTGNKIFDGKNIYIKVGNSFSLQFRDKGSESGGVYVYNAIITGGSESLDGTIGGGTLGMVISDDAPPGSTAQTLGKFLSENEQKEIISECKTLASKLLKNTQEKGIESNSILKCVYAYCLKYGNPVTDKTRKGKVFSSKSKGSSYSNFHVKDIEEFYKNIKSYAYDNKGKKYSDRALTQWLFTKYFGGKIIETMEKDKTAATIIVKKLMKFVGSRHKNAAPHFKASDSSAF